MNSPTFWDNKEEAESIVNELSSLNKLIDPILEIKEKINTNIELANLILEEYDESIFNEINNDIKEINNKIEELELNTYLSGEYDKNNCILEIHSGAGGTEACDWANVLYRMYQRYCKKNNFEFIDMDKLNGEEVGIKSATIMIKGNNAYGYLKNEKGVHRLVRISPFDSNKRRHTSFASIEVIPEFDKNINIEINENDLRIDIYRSSGPGGQGVNTTDSAVRITHLPTKIVVTCQNERSQIKNKEQALNILKSKLFNLELEKQNNKISQMTEGQMSIAFGSGKRSYVMCPYTLVKDNDTNYETSDVNKVLDGEIEEFINQGIRSGKNA